MSGGYYPKDRRREPKVYAVDRHCGWGNAIYLDDDGKRCHGHLIDRPLSGDILEVKMVSGKIGRFRVVEVEYCYDPRDMFFAKIRFVQYVGEQPLPEASDFPLLQRAVNWWNKHIAKVGAA